jgi:hypothetical protein
MAAGSAYHSNPKDATAIRPDAPRPGEASARSGGVGWIGFAGAFLLITGVMNLIWGFVALTDNDYFREDSLLWSSLTFWGWVGLIAGLAQAATGAALLARKAVGGLVAMGLAMIGILINFLAVGAYPIWSVIMMVCNALVIYAVSAGADELD